jgi:hypothetical protein
MVWVYKEKPQKEWTRWFAWHMVPIGVFPIKDGDTVVWLQWVERKWLDSREGCSSYAYRLIPGLEGKL